jgi:type III restriction enzyme
MGKIAQSTRSAAAKGVLSKVEWVGEAFLEELMQEDGFVGWLRNIPRREWALCVPYELGGTKAFYPDSIVIRKKGKSLEVDFVEPHDDSRADTLAKAEGLAEFADRYCMEFGRLIITRKRGDFSKRRT